MRRKAKGLTRGETRGWQPVANRRSETQRDTTYLLLSGLL